MRLELPATSRPTVLLTPLLIALFAIATAFADEPLSNDDVIALVGAGVGPEVIIAKINASPTSFVLTTDAILQLKKAKVPDAVIKAMLDRANAKTAPTAVQPTPPPQAVTLPLTLHDVGIPKLMSVCRGDVTFDANGITFEITEPYHLGSACPLPNGPENERKWWAAWDEVTGICYTFWDSGKTHGQTAPFTTAKNPELLFRNSSPPGSFRYYGFGHKVTYYPGWLVLFATNDDLRAVRDKLQALKPELHGKCGDDFD
jgi:hypothetical protein